MSDIRLVAGLGNPGREYQQTRHNIGFLVVHELAGALNAPRPQRAHRAEIVDVAVNGRKVILARPQTYMNLSGLSVLAIMRFHRIGPEELLVIHDDLDLSFGRIRLRPGGGAGGHNGVRSLIDALGTQQLARVRVGIGRPEHGDPMRYVLGRWTREEMESLGAVLSDAVDATRYTLEFGLRQAMNEFNGR